MPKPYPIYTDGVNLYTSFDGGATLLPLGGETATNNVAAPISGDGTIATPFTIAAGAIALTKLATQANNTVVGNIAGTASPVALTATQLTALINPATASLPGAMTAAQFVALQNVGEYQLDIDYTTTGDQGIIVPARASQIFVVTRYSQMVLAITGTASGTAPTISMGVSAAFTSLLVATAPQTTTSLNTGPGQFNAANITGTNAAQTSNAAIHVSIGTAVTGATVLSCRIAVLGYWTTVAF